MAFFLVAGAAMAVGGVSAMLYGTAEMRAQNSFHQNRAVQCSSHQHVYTGLEGEELERDYSDQKQQREGAMILESSQQSIRLAADAVQAVHKEIVGKLEMEKRKALASKLRERKVPCKRCGHCCGWVAVG